MSSVLPVGITLRNELYVGLIYQGGWLQGMVPPLAVQVADGKAVELLVHDGNQFAGGLLIAVGKLFQQRGYVGRDGHSVPPPGSPSLLALDDILLRFLALETCSRLMLRTAWALFSTDGALDK